MHVHVIWDKSVKHVAYLQCTNINGMHMDAHGNKVTKALLYIVPNMKYIPIEICICCFKANAWDPYQKKNSDMMERVQSSLGI